MSSDASDAVAANKRAGTHVETTVATVVPALRLIPDRVAEHYDAVATTRVTPTDDLAFAECRAIERGTVVEIKSVIVVYGDGRRGRFYFRPTQHTALVAEAGVYLFAVCDQTDDRERDIRALKIVSATAVDSLLGEWLDGGPGRSDYAQLAWSNFFAIDEVEA